MGRPLPAGLGTALERGTVEAALDKVVRERFGAGARVRGIASEIVRRRVVRYRIDLEGAGSGAAKWSVIGKVYESRAAGTQGFAALTWLWQRGFAESEPRSVVVPRALAYVPEPEVLLMEEVGGQSLQRLLKDGRAGVEHLRLFAEGLAKLHRFPESFGTPFTLEDHLEKRCAALVGSLKLAFPAQAGVIARIVETARRAESEPLLASYTLAHGDYHPGQVHLEDGRLWLVDLDPLHRGDPAYDVAMALVVLERFAARDSAACGSRKPSEVFLSGYFARMDPRIAERVPLNAALIFLKRACKRFRWRDEAGWEEDVRLQLRQGAECLTWLESLRPLRTLSDVIEMCARCPRAP